MRKEIEQSKQQILQEFEQKKLRKIKSEANTNSREDAAPVEGSGNDIKFEREENAVGTNAMPTAAKPKPTSKSKLEEKSS